MPRLAMAGASAARAFGFLRTAIANAVDQYFNLTTLLLPGNGTNGAQNNTFLDSSSNNRTITRDGNTTQGTFSPFSQTGWSNYFDGSNSFLQRASPSSALFDWTSTNWTLEFWIYANAFGQGSNTGSNVIGNASDSANNEYWSFGPINTGAVRWYYFTGASPSITTTTTLATNRWYHLAFVNNGGNLAIYIDGVSSATGTIVGTPQFGSAFPINVGKVAGNAFTGYLSNLRITQSAVYTSNFTPSTTPLTAISGTQLLMCQGNRFRDISTNAFAFTPSGAPSVQAFSPFAPTAAYDVAVNGASAFFDGSGDLLSLPTSINSSIGAIAGKQLTFEFWINTSEIAAVTAFNMGFFGNFVSAAANGRYGIYLLGSSTTSPQSVQFGWTTGTTTTASVITTATLNQKSWNHVAITVNATSSSNATIVIYINGVGQTFTGQNLSSQTADPNYNFHVGDTRDGLQMFRGHMGGFKISSGIQRTGNFTPPTSPFTSDGNTILLLNYQNAGITDATAKNALETVGNAQISTTQSKFGGSSISFDGDTDYVGFPKNENVNLGSGNFTIEFWAYWNAFGSDKKYCISVTDAGNYWQFNHDSTSGVGFIIGGVGSIFLQGNNTGWSTGTWYHIALVRNGTTLTVYRNGVSLASGTLSGSLANHNTFCVGGSAGFPTTTMNGYIDDFRLTKGYARYTANFTPPASAFALQ